MDTMENMTFDEMPLVAERGSLVLRGDVESGDLYVGFADHFEHKGVGSLAAVRDWHEIYSDTVRREVRLNGSQAKTVALWDEEYC